jgi:cell division protein ZipA
MDGLRWLLLLFGVLVVAGVYIYSRRQPRDGEDSPSLPHKSPTFGGDTTGPPESIAQSDDTDEAADDVASDDDAQQKIVTLRLVARNRGTFRGDELILSLRGIGMRHGKFGIFHRIDGDDEDRIIFSAASLVEPGSFNFDNIKEQEIPGISLFLILPGPVEGVEAFDMMIAAARTLGQSLHGELLDESGSTLSIQRERYMREEIVQFEHSNKVA